jgi:hypothetical protein
MSAVVTGAVSRHEGSAGVTGRWWRVGCEADEARVRAEGNECPRNTKARHPVPPSVLWIGGPRDTARARVYRVHSGTANLKFGFSSEIRTVLL